MAVVSESLMPWMNPSDRLTLSRTRPWNPRSPVALGPFEVPLEEVEGATDTVTQALTHFASAAHGWTGSAPEPTFRLAVRPCGQVELTVVIEATPAERDLAERVVQAVFRQ